MKTKKVTITLSEECKNDARRISAEIFGKSNISGLFAYWINQNKKSKKIII